MVRAPVPRRYRASGGRPDDRRSVDRCGGATWAAPTGAGLGYGAVMSPPEGRFIFPSAIEGILKGLGPLVTPELVAHLKAKGLDVHHLPPAIPAEHWPERLVDIAVITWPELTRDEALRKLGAQFIRGWQRTALGSAASALLTLLGPARTLTRLDRAIRTSDNFTRTETVLDGPNAATVKVSDVQGCPTYWVGVLEAGLEFLGREGAATLLRHEPPAATYRLTWK